jgi:hypothetical protein
MLCGHVSTEGQRTDTFAGNTVYTLMSDYQGRTNGGNGWMRILEFDPVADEIHVTTYSPTLQQFENDSDSQFTLAYPMQGGSGFQLSGSVSKRPVGKHRTVHVAEPGAQHPIRVVRSQSRCRG